MKNDPISRSERRRRTIGRIVLGTLCAIGAVCALLSLPEWCAVPMAALNIFVLALCWEA